jgi:hypothetical protein
MRYFVLGVVLICSQLAVAKDRNWQDAIFLGGTSTQNGAIAVPVGGMVVAGPLHSENFWFRLNGLDYCLNFPSRLSGRIPNLTVNGHTKIAIEGRRVHVLDDDGRDWKLTIVGKVAHH